MRLLTLTPAPISPRYACAASEAALTAEVQRRQQVEEDVAQLQAELERHGTLSRAAQQARAPPRYLPFFLPSRRCPSFGARAAPLTC